MYYVIALFLLVSSNYSFSSTASDTYTIETFEVPLTRKQRETFKTMNAPVDPGTVIAWGKDIVALGEAVYNLVIKGKPTITTSMTPISVVPRDPMTRNYVEPMELEEASDPIKRRFFVSAKNGFGVEVVRVEFLLLFQVAKYQGRGKYILNAIILPKVHVGYGFDFSSEMRLVGIANKGRANDPIVSVVLNMHYKIGSLNGFEENAPITLTGNGDVTLR